MRIIWAIGNNKPPNEDTLHYHGQNAETRGVKSMTLLVETTNIPSQREGDAFSVDLLMTKVIFYTVPFNAVANSCCR